jgi:hypothetical protein
LDEWMDADASQEFLGQSSVSFLAASIKLFLDEMRADFRGFSPLPEFDLKCAKDKGFVAANQKWFGDIEIDFTKSGSDLSIIEEVVTTRNSAQHPSSLLSMNVVLKGKQVKRRPAPFFAHDWEVDRIDPNDPDTFERYQWTLSVRREKFLQAIDEVDKLCEFVYTQSRDLQHRVRVEIGRRRKAEKAT